MQLYVYFLSLYDNIMIRMIVDRYICKFIHVYCLSFISVLSCTFIAYLLYILHDADIATIPLNINRKLMFNGIFSKIDENNFFFIEFFLMHETTRVY